MGGQCGAVRAPPSMGENEALSVGSYPEGQNQPPWLKLDRFPSQLASGRERTDGAPPTFPSGSKTPRASRTRDGIERGERELKWQEEKAPGQDQNGTRPSWLSSQSRVLAARGV